MFVDKIKKRQYKIHIQNSTMSKFPSIGILRNNHVDQVCAILSSGPVEITSAELSHAGRYSCTAKNAAGSTQRHIQLTVQGKN